MPLIGGYEPANEGAASKSEAALSLAQSLSQSGGQIEVHKLCDWVHANHLGISSQQERTHLGSCSRARTQESRNYYSYII